MCTLYGREIKAMPFLGLWSEEDRDEIVTIVSGICQDAAGAVLDVDLFSARGRRIACEFLLLPLRHGATSRDRILGSCAAHRRPVLVRDRPDRAPEDIGVGAGVARRALPWALAADRSRFVSLPPAFFRSGGGRRHGHLYVVDGGKS